MASYYVLTPPGMTNAEKQTLFIRDGFSWLAFIFPLPWLLVRKLWLLAGLSVVLYLVAIMVAEYWGLDGLPLAYTIVLSLWTGIEGGHVRATWLQRRGWDLQATIAAEGIDDAEAIYFGAMPEAVAAAPSRGFAGSITSHPSQNVALGLIGPYGSR
jgi:hypothetical protein